MPRNKDIQDSFERVMTMALRAFEHEDDRFEEAVRRAARFAGSLGRSPMRRAHAHDAAALVIQTEADSELAVAAMMHDLAEGAIDDACVDAVREQFGERVARVVAWCGENGTHPMPPFRGLDEFRIAELLCATRDVLIVAAVDTLSAVRQLRRDLQAGTVAAVASRGTAESMHWFMREADAVFRDRLRGHSLTGALSGEIEALAGLLQRIGYPAAG